MDMNEHELFGAAWLRRVQFYCIRAALRAAGARLTQRRGYTIMGRPGLEPGTNALKGRCSTD